MLLKFIKFNCVKSTNDVAIKLIKSKKNFKGIVVSNFQTKGRGTMGKKWISYQGNFFVSIFFELKKNMPDFQEFSKINPLILKKILNEYTHNRVKIKWPNDLMIKNRKVCGILQELVTFERKLFLIIGIGINTISSPKSSKFKGISLLEESNKLIDNSDILKKIKKSYEMIFYNYRFNRNLMKK